MDVFEIQLTTEEADHPNLARVGHAPVPKDRVLPNLQHAVTDGQSEQKKEPAKTVRIPHCHPILFTYLYVIIQSNLFFNTL